MATASACSASTISGFINSPLQGISSSKSEPQREWRQKNTQIAAPQFPSKIAWNNSRGTAASLNASLLTSSEIKFVLRITMRNTYRSAGK